MPYATHPVTKMVRLNPALGSLEKKVKFSGGSRRKTLREIKGGSNQPPARKSHGNYSREGDDGVKQGATRKKEREGMLEKRPVLKEQGMRAQGVLWKT